MDASWITLNIYTLSTASISIVEPVFLAISPMAYRSIRWFSSLARSRYSLLDYKWFVDVFKRDLGIILILLISVFFLLYFSFHCEFTFLFPPLPPFLIKSFRLLWPLDDSNLFYSSFIERNLNCFSFIKSIFSLDFFFINEYPDQRQYSPRERYFSRTRRARNTILISFRNTILIFHTT